MAATTLRFDRIATGSDDTVAVLALARPEAANSFNDEVIRELAAHLDTAAKTPHCRALVLCGEGKHFSAGADLAWMKSAAQMSYEENVASASELAALMEKLARLPLPTIAAVHGSAFGGAVGLTACCDIAIAAPSARFCLSEVRLGMMPAIILPYLARRMRPGTLRRFSLTARRFDADEALEAGLVDVVAAAGDDEAQALAAAVQEELSLLVTGAPQAQAAFKKLHAELLDDSLQQGPRTVAAIADLRAGPVGQAGLAAFFAKKSAPWALRVVDTWRHDQKSPEN